MIIKQYDTIKQLLDERFADINNLYYLYNENSKQRLIKDLTDIQKLVNDLLFNVKTFDIKLKQDYVHKISKKSSIGRKNKIKLNKYG